MDDRWARVRDKLTQARASGAACFGSEAHGFALGPTLSDAEIRAFEERIGSALPDGFRGFLQHVGHGGPGPYGGAGPYYGLYALDRAERWDDGTLCLGTQGCSFMTQLVLDGPDAGRVLYLDADGGPGHLVPDADFPSWYERWLDELLEGRDITWFGFGAIGDEASFARSLTGVDGPGARQEAARGLLRFNLVLPPTRDALFALTSADDPTLRRLGLEAVGRFSAPLDTARVRACVSDPDPDVREAAWGLLVAHDAAAVADDAFRAALAEPAEACGFRTWLGLANAKVLDDGRLRASAACANPLVRQEAVRRVAWTSDDGPWLLELARDARSDTRLAVAHVLARRKPAGAGAALAGILACAEEHQREHILAAIGTLGDPALGDVVVPFLASERAFLRLAAVRTLCQLDDARVIPVARALLANVEHPREASGNGTRTHVRTEAQLTRAALELARAPAIRALL